MPWGKGFLMRQLKCCAFCIGLVWGVSDVGLGSLQSSSTQQLLLPSRRRASLLPECHASFLAVPDENCLTLSFPSHSHDVVEIVFCYGVVGQSDCCLPFSDLHVISATLPPYPLSNVGGCKVVLYCFHVVWV